MAVTRNYPMEYGNYRLSASEVVILNAFRNAVDQAFQQHPDKEGLAVPLHKFMLWLMSDTPTDPKPADFSNWTVQDVYNWSEQTSVGENWTAKEGIDLGVWTVIWGAVDINQGFNEASTFQGRLIAEYTIAQIMAREGETRERAMELNQIASNQIALNLSNEIVVSNGQIPLLVPFGAVDAGAAASAAFGGDYPGWAGVAFFPFLGETGRTFIDHWLLEHEQVVGTAGDSNQQTTFKNIEGAYDLVAFLYAGEKASWEAFLGDVGGGMGRLLEELMGDLSVPVPDQTELVNEITLYFNRYYGLEEGEFPPIGESTILYPFGTASAIPKFVVGTLDDDAAIEGTGARVVHAGPGDDFIEFGGPFESIVVDGGDGVDILDVSGGFSYPSLLARVVIDTDFVSLEDPDLHGRLVLEPPPSFGDSARYAYNIEGLVLGSSEFVLWLDELTDEYIQQLRFIDLGRTDPGQPSSGDNSLYGGDQVDLSSSVDSLRVSLIDPEAQTFTLKDHPEYSLTVKNANIVHTGSGNDEVIGGGKYDGKLTQIFTGAGDDVVKQVVQGTVVHTGAGRDTVELGNVVLYADLDGDDAIYSMGQKLTGAVASGTSESPWALRGHLRMGLNEVGELIIENGHNGHQTFLSDAKVQHNVAAAERTAGLLIYKQDISATRLLDDDLPSGWLDGFFRASLGLYMKAMTGTSYYEGVDPLVLDLDGDGVELSARGAGSPRFDIDGDGFAEPTGWVLPGDGLLALDRDGNGTIDDVTELFGSPTSSGLAELALHDDTQDGVIDAADGVFANLRVWQDADRDGLTDAGELLSLDALGIQSISLAGGARRYRRRRCRRDRYRSAARYAGRSDDPDQQTHRLRLPARSPHRTLPPLLLPRVEGWW